MFRTDNKTFEKFAPKRKKLRHANGKSSCNRLRKSKPKYFDEF